MLLAGYLFFVLLCVIEVKLHAFKYAFDAKIIEAKFVLIYIVRFVYERSLLNNEAQKLSRPSKQCSKHNNFDLR